MSYDVNILWMHILILSYIISDLTDVTATKDVHGLTLAVIDGSTPDPALHFAGPPNPITLATTTLRIIARLEIAASAPSTYEKKKPQSQTHKYIKHVEKTKTSSYIKKLFPR